MFFEDMNLKRDLPKGMYMYGIIIPFRQKIISLMNSIINGFDTMIQSPHNNRKKQSSLISILQSIDENGQQCQYLIVTARTEHAHKIQKIL